jgi:hypothetical protein
MKIHIGLLRIYWRQVLPATVMGMLGLASYVLFYPGIIGWNDPLPLLPVGLQSLLLAWLPGRFSSPAFAFIYSRGYSRDQLWGHLMLANALSVLAAWLPASLIIWAGLRSDLFDHMLLSPYFPVMAPLETPVPWTWLCFYIVLIPPFLFAWIRKAQPCGGELDGVAIAVAVLVVDITILGTFNYFGQWYWLVADFVIAVISVCLLYGGRKLHRSLEAMA